MTADHEDTCGSCGKALPVKRSPVGRWCCRVWFYVDRATVPGGCWQWTGARNANGYGFLSRPGKRSSNSLAHRAVYELAVGPIPPGLVLMHTCDVPACCNPAHLVPGTQRENIHDAQRKGRLGPINPLRGEACPHATLTEELVRQIRQLRTAGYVQRVIADRLGVTRSAVCDVLRGRTWGHVS